MVDGDVFELDPAVLERLRAAVEEVDKSEAERRGEMMAQRWSQTVATVQLRHHAERQSIDDADGTETARSMNPARDFAAGIKTGDGLMRAHVDDFAFGRNQNAAHRVMDLRANAAGVERRFG